MRNEQIIESDRPNLIKNHKTLRKLQERGYKVEPIHNKHTGRFDENLVAVNNVLCFMLPLDVNPKILSFTVLENTDYIIVSTSEIAGSNYYIIPSDYIIKEKEAYELEYLSYKDAWNFLELNGE